MKISNILIALAFLLTASCGPKKTNDHGHEHGTEEHGHSHDGVSDDHSHDPDEHHGQEEFTIEGDSVKMEKDSGQHTHEDGSTHHDH